MSSCRKVFVVSLLFSFLLACNLPEKTLNFWMEYLAVPFNDSNVQKCVDQGGKWDIELQKCTSDSGQEIPLSPEDDGLLVEEPAPSIALDELPGAENPAPGLTIEEELPGEVTIVGTATVRLIPLDVRTLETPPEIIVIAQYSTSPPPPNVTIESVSNLWKSADGEKIALYNGGDWIEATCHDLNITAVGVRFESDANDGWVSVLVDGVEMWRGNIHGGAPGSEEGMFLHYLEVSGLEPGVHTIRVENLGIDGGEGGDDAAMRYFGFSSMPVSGYEP
ncbi:MAG: hypothetical protein HN390_17020 [Anaerolineae bacterium]|jgi:hypothetical protein|nr:hypothetical protein [Anaerolineae bacterium]MBT7189148.1 hypothetical protein [Anaerolineae bacterium]MBT7988568.1 hypothetical protein [Anaerolineae bacterium]